MRPSPVGLEPGTERARRTLAQTDANGWGKQWGVGGLARLAGVLTG